MPKPRALLIAVMPALLVMMAGALLWHWHLASREPVVTETSGTDIATMLDADRLSDDQREAVMAALPVVLRENLQIAQDRQRVQDISNLYLHDSVIDEDDFNWLKGIAAEYQLQPQSRSDSHFFGELLARVDTVPPSLVLAHLIQNGSSLNGTTAFDALTFRRENCNEKLCIGLGLRTGKVGKGLAATNPYDLGDDAIQRYMLRLNTSEAYEEFRLQRLGLRNRGEVIRGLPLVDSLQPPALRDPGYVNVMRKLIERNNLQDMD